MRRLEHHCRTPPASIADVGGFFKLNMKRFILLVAVCFLLGACQSDRQQDFEHTQLYAIDSSSFFMGLPARMASYKDYLFVHDVLGEEGLISVVDPLGDSVLFSFLKKGGGPDEVVSFGGPDLFSHNGHDLLGVFDTQTQKYRAYAVDSILVNRTLSSPVFEGRVELPYPVYQVQKTDHGYIARGFFTEGKFVLLDDSLTLVRYAGAYRPQKTTNFPADRHAWANIGRSGMAPDRKHLASFLLLAGVVEFYALDADTVTKVWEYVKHELDYDVKNSGSIRNKNVEGFLDVYVTDRHVFALYSGEMKNPEGGTTLGKHVFQFDRMGNLVRIYELDRRVFGLLVDGNRMKAFVENPEPMIVEYEIKTDF